MTFIDKIQSDMYKYMKSGKKKTTTTLRTLLAKLKDRQINTGIKLSEQEGLNVVKTLVKQRKESMEMYEAAGRSNLAEQERFEFKILESYLPQMLSEKEIRLLVISIIEETGASSMSDIGKVMPLIMQRGSGKVDGKTANLVLRELLE